MKRTTIAMLLCAGMANLQAQNFWETTGNNSMDPITNFLGTDDQAPMNIRTEDIRRFRLNYDETYTIGTFGGQVKNGSLLLSPGVDQFYLNGANGPFSLFHIAAADDNAQQGSYREWMDIGLTLTGNADHSYIGLKAAALDNTDVVFHWSDNPSKFLKDRVRFIFTSGYDPTDDTGAGSLEGLEALRLFPVDNDNVNVGIGDWFAANFNDPSITEPEERLDIVDGRVRIRQLPTEAEAESLDKFVVVAPSGVLGWRNIPPGTLGCEWNQWNLANHLRTAWSGAAVGCPNENSRVGIGVGTVPEAKLHVANTVGGSASNHAGWFDMQGSTGNNAGIRAMAKGSPGSENYGVQGRAYNASSKNFGLHGWGILDGNGTTSENHGVYGSGQVGEAATCTTNYALRAYALANGTTTDNYGLRANARANGTTTNNYGIHAVANGSGAGTHYGIWAEAPGSSPHWAGYFVGRTHCTLGAWTSSDENLKTDIADLEGSLEKVLSLEPKSYRYNSSTYGFMGYDDSQHIGLLAQNVESVLPELVAEVTHPASYDENGDEINPAVDFKAIRYDGLIPVLIAAMKDQQAIIAEQSSRLDHLETALANCCALPGNDADQRSGSIDNSQLTDPASERLLTIAPNPFTDRTTVSYTLERGGRAQLLVNSSDGKHLQVLEEGVRSEGQYNYTWSTAHLAPGVYYVTLLLDGEPLVKRAVKVQ